MAGKTTPSYVIEIPLVTTSNDLTVLAARLEAGRQLYNATLSESTNRLSLVRNSELYQIAKAIPKTQNKERRLAFQKAKEVYRYSDYDLQAFANQTAIASVWIKQHLDANTIQKIATRAFKATDRMLFGKAKKVRFKGKGQLASLEGKTNKRPQLFRRCTAESFAAGGIRWTGSGVEWLGLNLAAVITNDPVILHGLSAKLKYVRKLTGGKLPPGTLPRLVRRILNQKTYWFAQLVCEGNAYQKPQNLIGNGLVGIDLGVATVAIVGDSETIWVPFAKELTSKQKQIRRLQRKMARQRRAGNSSNYNQNGTAKKGSLKKWNNSKRYKKTAAKKREIERSVFGGSFPRKTSLRKQAAHRKSLHGRLVNRTLRLGKNVKAEKVSVKGWQKLFGKSIGFKAPGSFQSELVRKAESAGGQVLLFSTQKTALSQTCLCGIKQKKALSQRVHNCSKCGLVMQRDILSANLTSIRRSRYRNAVNRAG